MPSAEASRGNAEAALVVAAQMGETSAFDALMRAYRERIFGVVYNLVGNSADAADVTQDVFIKAFTHIRKYNFQSAFFTWIYRIAVREALNFQRRARSKKGSLIDRMIAHLQPAFETGPSRTQEERLAELAAAGQFSGRAEAALSNELQAQLDRALQSLSAEHRASVVLVEVEGLSLAEAAEVLSCSVGTLKSRLHYAKKHLQTLLKGYLTS